MQLNIEIATTEKELLEAESALKLIMDEDAKRQKAAEKQQNKRRRKKLTA